jgi:hypothetical protein
MASFWRNTFILTGPGLCPQEVSNTGSDAVWAMDWPWLVKKKVTSVTAMKNGAKDFMGFMFQFININVGKLSFPEHIIFCYPTV